MPSSPATPFFVIAGPTASGKTRLAVEVAVRCGGEILGADAYQIYAGLPVLTAQPSVEMRTCVPHHLVGEIPLTETFDLGQYVALANQRLGEIRARGRIPVVCGGSGLHLRALCRGLAELPPADPALRAEIAARPLEELARELKELDPAGAAQLDLKNPRRLVRALEVCLLTGRPYSSFRQQWSSAERRGHGIVLLPERAELMARIDRRAAALFDQGVEDEVRAADAASSTAVQAIGLREIRDLQAGRVSRAECLAAIRQATRRYAKRQLTWFRREPDFAPVASPPESQLGALADQLAAQARNC